MKFGVPTSAPAFIAVDPHALACHAARMSQARRIPTYADILALPPHITGQIVAGELYAHPRPRSLHAKAESNLIRHLGAFDDDTQGPDDPGGWVILVEPELHLGDDVLVPDLAGWRSVRATWPREAAYIEITPDWIGEVISGSTEVFDRSVKMPAYAHHGVRHAWLVDPDAKILEVYELAAGVLRQLGPAYRDRALVTTQPFAEKTIEMRRVWGE